MALFLIVIVCSCVQVVRPEVLLPDHRVFLWQILEKYGQNGTIPFEGFERLYRNLGLGSVPSKPAEVKSYELSTKISPTEATLSRNKRDTKTNQNNATTICKSQEDLAKLIMQHREVVRPPDNEMSQPPKSCLTVREVLSVYGLPQGETLGPVSFLHLCPAIVYQLDQGTCARHGEGQHNHAPLKGSTNSSWIFAGLSWLVISVSGMIIVTLVPLLQNTLLNQLIGFLVALAVGTLLGDAFLHLIPHALMDDTSHEEGSDHLESLKKTGLMFLTVVFFFTFESVINTVRSNKEKQKVQVAMNYVSVNTNENEREMLEINKSSSPAHSHSHSHGPRSNTTVMVVLGDGLHNLTDGLAIGAAFSGGLAPGFATAVAVFTHELPHELGDFAVLLQSGVTVRRALLFNMLSSALSLVGTVIGLVIGNFGDVTKYVYAVTAGCFSYIALCNVVPEINRQNTGWSTVILRLCGILSGGFLMACIAVYEHDLQQLFS